MTTSLRDYLIEQHYGASEKIDRLLSENNAISRIAKDDNSIDEFKRISTNWAPIVIDYYINDIHLNTFNYGVVKQWIVYDFPIDIDLRRKFMISVNNHLCETNNNLAKSMREKNQILRKISETPEYNTDYDKYDFVNMSQQFYEMIASEPYFDIDLNLNDIVSLQQAIKIIINEYNESKLFKFTFMFIPSYNESKINDIVSKYMTSFWHLKLLESIVDNKVNLQKRDNYINMLNINNEIVGSFKKEICEIYDFMERLSINKTTSDQCSNQNCSDSDCSICSSDESDSQSSTDEEN